MAFKISDFHDLVDLLETHPRWRAQLRRLVLTEDVVALPRIVRELAAAQQRAEERLTRLETVVQELAEAQKRTEERLTRLEAVVQQLAEAQWQTQTTLHRLVPIVACLQGTDKERFYRDRAAAIFGLFLTKGRDATPFVVQVIHQAVADGRLTHQAGRDILLADLLWSGHVGERTIILVGEASWTVSTDDVVRAVRRAKSLRQIGLDAVPFVGGEEWSTEAQELAVTLGVATATDGQCDDAAWEAALRQYGNQGAASEERGE